MAAVTSAAIAGGAGLLNSLVGGLFGRKNAKTQAAAAAQDQRQTTVDTNTMQQLMEEISKMDKNVAEQLFGTSNTNEIMNSLQQLTAQQQQQETTTQTTERGGAGTNAALDTALQQVSGNLAGGGDAAFQAAVNQVLRSGMPAVANMGNRAGTFGDTTTALLQNDLAVKAAEAGVGAQQQAQSQNVSQLAQLAQALQQGREQTTGVGNTTSNTTQTQTGQQSNQSSTETTQDRTAQETTTNQTQQGTSAVQTGTSDTLIDFGKDNSMNANQIINNLGKTNTGPNKVNLPTTVLPTQLTDPVNTGQAPLPGTNTGGVPNINQPLPMPGGGAEGPLMGVAPPTGGGDLNNMQYVESPLRNELLALLGNR